MPYRKAKLTPPPRRRLDVVAFVCRPFAWIVSAAIFVAWILFRAGKVALRVAFDFAGFVAIAVAVWRWTSGDCTPCTLAGVGGALALWGLLLGAAVTYPSPPPYRPLWWSVGEAMWRAAQRPVWRDADDVD